MNEFRNQLITVYTPTYNRGYCLSDLYESLCRQSTKNFKWLIIDDGSTDNTSILVEQWKNEAPFIIDYFKQINEGKMAKLNFAHTVIDTELCVCIDSDDFLLDNAISLIVEHWNRFSFDNSIGGMVGIATDKEDNIIGTVFPKKIDKVKFVCFDKLGIKGDKIFIYRTSVIKSMDPYPSIKGERFPAPGYLFRLIDEKYDLSVIHKVLVKKDYLEDGLSKNKYAQFKNAPNSFVYYRQERMRLAISNKEKFKNAIHYVSSCLFAKKGFFKKNNYPIITFLALPFGYVLHFYLLKTNKKGVV